MKTVTGADDGSTASGTTAQAVPIAAVAFPPAEPAELAAPEEPAPPAQAGPGRLEEPDDPPFWTPYHPSWPVLPVREPRRRRRPPRRPALGLVALVVLALVATFVAWVTAEPLWLTVGHREPGTATVTRCSVEDAPYECVTFTAASGRYVTEDVTLLGTAQGQLRQGTTVPAEMVSPRGDRAYAIDRVGLRLRTGVGLALILLCGLGIAWATGATRLDDQGVRRRAYLACVAAPLLVLLAFLAVSW
jgi:hypothetical protein